jgi:hypothetical protein
MRWEDVKKSDKDGKFCVQKLKGSIGKLSWAKDF